MKLITFLGTGNYQDTNYVWQPTGETVATKFFPEVVVKLFNPQKTFVMLTNEAKNHNNWKELQERLISANVQFEEVDIPSGQSIDEIWQIFNALTKVVEEEDEVIFDITHAFRSLPTIALLASAYLKEAKNVKIKNLLYGAYEAGDNPASKSPVPAFNHSIESTSVKCSEPGDEIKNNCPIFDLSEFLSILDWITAAHIFAQTGNSTELAKILSDIQGEAYKKGHKNPPKTLNPLAKSMSSLSNALMVIRPQEITKSADGLKNNLHKLREELAEELDAHAKPMQLLLEKISNEYDLSASTLEEERKIINWYCERHHIPQALSLAREWLVSLVAHWLNLDPIKQRKPAERALGQYSTPDEKKPETEEDKKYLALLSDKLKQYPKKEALGPLWNKISEARNDVDHCGKNETPSSAQSVIDKTKGFISELNELPLEIPENDQQ